MAKEAHVDACFECYSLDLSIVELDDNVEDADVVLVHVACRNCGEEWEDEIEA